MTDPRPTLRALYADLNQARAQAVAADRRILETAKDRLERVQRRIERLRSRVQLDEAAGNRYAALILERARLRQVLLRGEPSS